VFKFGYTFDDPDPQSWILVLGSGFRIIFPLFRIARQDIFQHFPTDTDLGPFLLSNLRDRAYSALSTLVEVIFV